MEKEGSNINWNTFIPLWEPVLYVGSIPLKRKMDWR
jgi:hypothetical protein